MLFKSDSHDPRYVLPIGRCLFNSTPNFRRRHALRVMHVLKAEPTLVANPPVVHIRIKTRPKPVDPFIGMIDPDRAAGGAPAADRRRLAQLPDAALEQEVLVQQASHRAEIDDVALQGVIQRQAGENVDFAPRASIDNAQLIRTRYLIREPNTARAHHATVLIQQRFRPDVLLRVLELRLHHTRLRLAEPETVVLKVAFARLVADRTIQRVVKQIKLHAILLTVPDLLRVEPNHQALTDRRLARGDQLGGPAHLPGLGVGHLHFHQAKSARGHHAQARMVAVVRHFPPGLQGRLQHGNPVAALNGLVVNRDPWHQETRRINMNVRTGSSASTSSVLTPSRLRWPTMRERRASRVRFNFTLTITIPISCLNSVRSIPPPLVPAAGREWPLPTPSETS